MNTRKDIESAFREGSQKLTVEPSSHAWQKLERRLSSDKPQGKLVVLRWISAVAALFVLVMGVYYWSQPQGTTMAAMDNPPPKLLEDLVNTGDCNPYCMLIHSRNELPEYYARPVRNDEL